MKDRITPDKITRLKKDQVFVFGSNLSGAHVGGAARTALKWGAVMGKHYGLHGRTFAIPTVSERLGVLHIHEIRNFVLNFIKDAKQYPRLTFLVTEIGCGIAGYKPEEIAPLFERAIYVKNIHLPQRFWNAIIKNKQQFEELIKKYESVKMKDIPCVSPFYGIDVAYNLTGFGYAATCILCKHVTDCSGGIPNCVNCVWSCFHPRNEKYPCSQHFTYDNIIEAKGRKELKQAFMDRAKYMRKCLKSIKTTS